MNPEFMDEAAPPYFIGIVYMSLIPAVVMQIQHVISFYKILQMYLNETYGGQKEQVSEAKKEQ